MLSPRRDDEFDQHTRDVLTSINLVGVTKTDPQFFTTEHQKRRREEDLLCLKTFALAGGSVILTTPLVKHVPFQILPEAVYLAAVLLIAPFGFLKSRDQYYNFPRDLARLQEGANATDDYLKTVAAPYL